jgi:intracellular sulfur oxidation DsrE/DsrF family protein
MRSSKFEFDFTAMPKLMVTEKLTPEMVKGLKENGRMLFLIMNTTPPEPKKTDMLIKGFFMAYGVEPSEYIVVVFNDMGISFMNARDRLLRKWDNMKFPDNICGYTSIAINRSPNLLSSFIGEPKKTEQTEIA